MSLRARLTGVLLLLFLAVGTVLLLGIEHGARLYFEEVHYKLNRDVAGHLAKTLHPFVESREGGGEIDELDQDVLKGLFMDVMHTNPSLEVYLLDDEGRILAFDAPEGAVVRDHVDLAPVHAVLAKAPADGDARATPPRGDDPRSLDRTKPFSVAELRAEDGDLDGYLYVVLGGQAHQAVAASLWESALLRGALVLSIASLALAALAGALSIALLVRPLRRLRDAMIRFQHGERCPPLPRTTRDEVGDLAATFRTMAKRIEDQLDELRRTDRRRREFVANVSHDLRTPTSVVQGYLETLTLRWSRLDDGEREQFLRSALRQTERLASLVEQLFELARLEAAEFRPHRERFSAAELVQDVVAKFQPRAEERDVRLHGSIAYDLPEVFGDIGLIERALDNLIENALRHTPPGGSVRVGVEAVAGGVLLSIRDTGPGIAEEDRDRVFERFWRAEDVGVTVADGGGTGLGLAIAKRIVDLHAGSIDVSGEPGEGARFALRLPCEGDDDEGENDGSDVPNETVTAS